MRDNRNNNEKVTLFDELYFSVVLRQMESEETYLEVLKYHR